MFFSFHPMALQTFEGHTNYVSCVCAVPPNEFYPEGLVFSGSNDQKICAFNPNTTELLFQLEGHTNVGKFSCQKVQKLIFKSPDKKMSENKPDILNYHKVD